MFNLFNRKKKKPELTIFAPVAGRVMDITAVPDTVFSSKMIGDGIGIEPVGHVITAPCDGTVLLVTKTLHAVAIEAQGVEILIHIGIDTVELGGKGFASYVEIGDKVKKGDKLIAFDREYIIQQGKPVITPVVITNMEEKVNSIHKIFDSRDGAILKLGIKSN